jgi:hypothetical protein
MKTLIDAISQKLEGHINNKQHLLGIHRAYIEEPIYAVARKTNFGLSLLQEEIH